MRTEECDRLYRRYAGALLGFLAHRVGDPTLAEDLLADTFERVLRARSPFDRRKASEKTWLYAIALNLVRDEARRSSAGQRAAERLAGERIADPEDEVDAVAERDALQTALAHLSAYEREAIALRYGSDLTVREIARLKHLKLSTAEGRVYRALRKLHDELDLRVAHATTGQRVS